MTTAPKRQPVQAAAERLREMILAREPGAQIGSLTEIAQLLGVGIVTVQQAARILEHEGLLAVRRGPGGGYYGTRPDDAALERAFAAYLRVHGYGLRESYQMHQMLSLLDCEIAPAAARCKDEALRQELSKLRDELDRTNTSDDRVAFEMHFRDLVLKMAARPLVELLCRVTVRVYVPAASRLYPSPEAVEAWKSARQRILAAILEQDEELAAFEAERYRRLVQAQLGDRSA
jgi:DNA-binding FadR family transcriptional regulator